MLGKRLLFSAAVVSGVVSVTPASAQNEQFIPILSYRTGAYAVNGVPFANGMADYYAMINERDGGINGVKLLVEECETGYATDKGVECYERLKGKGPTGAAFVNPLSTGITFALTEKTTTDKIPIITMGYGRADSKNGAVFAYNFPLLGTYWSAADIAIQHIAKEVGGFGEGMRAATLVVEQIAKHCASTAMVVCMHYAGAAVIEAHGPRDRKYG